MKQRKKYRTAKDYLTDFIWKHHAILRAIREIDKTIMDLRANFQQGQPIERNLKKQEKARAILLNSLDIGYK